MALTIPFYIQTADPVLAASITAQFPNGVFLSPQAASAVFGLPIRGGWGPHVDAVEPVPPYDGTQISGVPGISWGDPYGIYPASPNPPTADYINIDFGLYLNQASFSVLAYDHSTNTGTPVYTVQTAIWVGDLVYLTGPPPPLPAMVGKRRWVNGFEIPDLGEGGSGNGLTQNRDASRHLGGFGLAFRGGNARVMNTSITSPFPTVSWERFYLRIRTYPVGGSDSFWACFGDAEGSLSALLTLSPTGVITAYNQGSASYPGAAMGTTAPLGTNVWFRLDLRIAYATAVPSFGGSFSLYLNGTPIFTTVLVAGTGLHTIQGHVGSQIGASGGSAFGSEIDFDDWISANEFLVASTPMPGFDLTTGSRVQLVRPTGGAGAWTGDFRTLIGNPQSNSPAGDVLATSTPSATYTVTTDYIDQQLGCAAMAVGVYVVTSSVVAGSVITASPGLSQSIKLPSNAWAQLSSSGGAEVQAPLYSVADGATLPLANIGPVSLSVTKDPGGTAVSIQTLLASAELLGTWGPEDKAGTTAPPNLGLHNGPFTTPQGLLQLTAAASPFTPVGQVIVESGTYVGNGTGQDILCSPSHWCWLRNVTSGQLGTLLFSSMEAAHNYVQQGFRANGIVQAQPGRLRLAGGDGQNNSNGETFQWISVSDPAMRYMINGAFSHKLNAGATANPLIDNGFTPDMAFLFAEKFGGTTSASYVKGAGHTGTTASPLDNAVVASVASLAAGSVTSQAILNTGEAQTAYSVWRKDDGSGNTGWFDQFTYTGNGAGGTRALTCNLAGRSPLFAIVTPHNGFSYFRDPSHTGTTSQTIGGTPNAATAIVGGDLNTITIGSALNSNGIVYDVFVLAGAISPGNWSGNPGGVPINVVPTIQRPTPGPYTPPPTPPVTDPGCISLGTAILELLTRLGDPLGVHWTVAECQRYLIEALHVWNGITCSARDRGTFTATAGQAFYDLPTVISALRAYTLHDQDLILDLEYLLQEPPSATTWTGTAMFSLDGLTEAIQRRRDRFLWETRTVATRELKSVTPDANGRVALPSDVITVLRAAWATASPAAIAPMLRDAEWGMNAYARNWPTPVAGTAITPVAWSVGVTPPLTLQLAPPPTVAGTLDTISTVLGATLNPATGVLLGVPDDFAWGTKWGALRDLLSAPGPANDPQRAAIAGQLWDLSVASGKASAVLLDARVNGSLVRIAGVADADHYQRGWQNSSGVPTRVLTAAPNLIALAPVPDSVTPYTILLDVVRNQPIPTSILDCYFEGGVALTQALLDYAEFCARFKEGPAQADEATTLLQSFLQATSVAIAIDTANQLATRKATLRESQRNQDITPTAVDPAGGTA